MRNILIFITILLISTNCSEHKSSRTVLHHNTPKDYSAVDIDMSSDFYDSIMSNVAPPTFIVLKESDNTLYSEIDKIVTDDDYYYILDSYAAKTVVSFTKDGMAHTKYGNIGQGPGEYAKPWDIDVDSEYLYVLDSNMKKILQFKKDGTLVKEQSIPFRAFGFKRLQNGGYVFNLLTDGKEETPRLCRTDSTISNPEYYLPAPKGYVGGFLTTDVLKSDKDIISFYTAPGDTLYYLDKDGVPEGGLVFNFGKMAVPEIAKVDYLAAREKGLLENTVRFTCNPIPLKGNLMAGTLTDDDDQYIVLFNSKDNKCGVRKCNPEKSVFEILEPATANKNGDLICYTTLEFLRKAKDFDSLPKTIREELNDNYHVLAIYSLSK